MTIEVNDAITFMQGIEDGSVDLVFADPPFNIGFHYDNYNDSMDVQDYLEQCEQWMHQVWNILKPNGTFWLMIGDENAAELKVRATGSCKFVLRSWVIWHYTFGVYCTKKFGRDHSHLLYFVKNPKQFTFNADEIRIPSARQEKYNDDRANPKGRIPGDVWTISRVCGSFKERIIDENGKSVSGCQTPESIAERIILTCTNEGDLVVDPMCGTGTMLAVAKRLGRRSRGCDVSEKCVAAAMNRKAKMRAIK